MYRTVLSFRSFYLWANTSYSLILFSFCNILFVRLCVLNAMVFSQFLVFLFFLVVLLLYGRLFFFFFFFDVSMTDRGTQNSTHENRSNSSYTRFIVRKQTKNYSQSIAEKGWDRNSRLKIEYIWEIVRLEWRYILT